MAILGWKQTDHTSVVLAKVILHKMWLNYTSVHAQQLKRNCPLNCVIRVATWNLEEKVECLTNSCQSTLHLSYLQCWFLLHILHSPHIWTCQVWNRICRDLMSTKAEKIPFRLDPISSCPPFLHTTFLSLGISIPSVPEEGLWSTTSNNRHTK